MLTIKEIEELEALVAFIPRPLHTGDGHLYPHALRVPGNDRPTFEVVPKRERGAQIANALACLLHAAPALLSLARKALEEQPK